MRTEVVGRASKVDQLHRSDSRGGVALVVMQHFSISWYSSNVGGDPRWHDHHCWWIAFWGGSQVGPFRSVIDKLRPVTGSGVSARSGTNTAPKQRALMYQQNELQPGACKAGKGEHRWSPESSTKRAAHFGDVLLALLTGGYSKFSTNFRIFTHSPDFKIHRNRLPKETGAQSQNFIDRIQWAESIRCAFTSKLLWSQTDNKTKFWKFELHIPWNPAGQSLRWTRTGHGLRAGSSGKRVIKLTLFELLLLLTSFVYSLKYRLLVKTPKPGSKVQQEKYNNNRYYRCQLHCYNGKKNWNCDGRKGE